MFKRSLALGLCVVFLNLFFSTSAFAATNAEKDAKFAAQVRSKIQKLGEGKDAQVQVKLKNGTNLKGYVSEINTDSFLIVNDVTGNSTEVLYSQTKQVKGNNLTTGAKIAIAAGIIVAIVAFIYFAGSSD